MAAKVPQLTVQVSPNWAFRGEQSSEIDLPIRD